MRINIPVTEAVENYLDQYGYREHPLLLKCRHEASTRGEMAVMQIAPEQGAFLALLVHLTGARKVLELGTFTGYSSLAIALALPEDGRIVTCDVSSEYMDLATEFWKEAGVQNKIDLRLGKATVTLKDLIAQGEGESFDLVFIDADKPAYPEYYEQALSLTRRGGLIILDDTLIHGLVVTGALQQYDEYVMNSIAALQALNRFIHEDKRVEMVLIPWRDGVTLARKV